MSNIYIIQNILSIRKLYISIKIILFGKKYELKELLL